MIDTNKSGSEEIQADPTTQKKLRRSLLLIALASLMAPWVMCWYSTRIQAIELILIPGLLGMVILLYTFYTLYQREQQQNLAPPLWRVGLIFVILIALLFLAIFWLMSSYGWHNISGLFILALGVWSLFLAGRRFRESWSFSQLAIEEENDQGELKMISIDGGHPIHPQLVYRYADNYRGQIANNRIRNKTPEIIQAIADKKLRVTIKYLPENPRVHRFLGWKILS